MNEQKSSEQNPMPDEKDKKLLELETENYNLKQENLKLRKENDKLRSKDKPLPPTSMF